MELSATKALAISLMEQHGLIEKGWKFEFDNAKKRFGICKYRPKIIGLSKILVTLNEIDKVKNTILHEIAHALTPNHGHDSIWKAKAKEIGCDGERCYKGETTNTPQSKYIAICPNCKHTHKKHKRPRYDIRQSCGRCSNRFNPNCVLDWKINPNFK